MGGVKSALGQVFRTQRVQVGQIAYSSGQNVGIDIPRGLLLKSIKCRLSGTVTIGSAALTSYFSENPLTLLQRVELVADGRKPFFSAPASMLYRMNHILDGKQPELSFSPASGTAAAHTFTAYFTIDPKAVRTVAPQISFLDTRLYDKLALNVQWASGGMFGPFDTTTTQTFTGVVLDIQAEYTTVGFEDVHLERLGITDEITVTATSNSLRLPVPRNGVLRSLLFQSLRDGVLDDTLVNNVSLRSENTVMHMDHLTWATMQSSNVMEYQIDSGVPAATTFGPRLTGYAFHELTEHFAIPTGLDTTSLNTLDLLFDVTLGSGTDHKIRVYYDFFQPAGR